MAVGTLTLTVQNEVTVSDKRQPVVGVFADSAGWSWDRRLFSLETNVSSGWWDGLGGETVGLYDGTQLTDWQSGVVTGIAWSELFLDQVESTWIWSPIYTTGSFAIHWDTRTLYSDYSVTQLVDPSQINGDGLVWLNMPDDLLLSTLTARIYHRDESFRILTWRAIDFVDTFTGALSGGARLDTGEPGAWTVANFSDRHWEMTIDLNGTLVFNQDPSYTVGYDAADEDTVRAYWEDAGDGQTEGRFIFLKHFPVDPDSVRLVTIAGGVVTEWTKQDHLYYSQSADQDFAVNADLGIIEVGGYQAPDLVVDGGVSISDTIVRVKLDLDAFASYSDNGIIVIGSEKIKYQGKGRSSFLNCTRGYDGTTAASHSANAVVSDVQHGASTTDELFVMYTAVPRVEYEVTHHDQRTANYSPWLNVHALVNPKPNNIVQIASVEPNIASIELTADAPLMGGSLYGPIYYGTDAIRLTATAYDSLGRRVDDVELTIDLLFDSPGGLNGSLGEYTATTNQRGEITCMYNSPYDRDEIELAVSSVVWSDSDTVLTVPGLVGNPGVNDVWVFQVLKHDPISGSVGKEVVPFATSTSDLPVGASRSIDVYMAHAEWPAGTLFVLGTDATKRTYPIVGSVPLPDTGSGVAMRFYVSNSANPMLGGGAAAWLLESGGLEWTTDRGTRVVLYKWYTAGEYRHPLRPDNQAASPSAPVAAPLHPSSVVGTTVTVANEHLPVPAPTDDSSNLGGYVVVAPGRATLVATGRDPYSGRLITSNQIQLSLVLPGPLSGVDSSGAVPIPYGWKLPTDDFNVGAGLGGVNFITINPRASGINRFTLSGAF